MIITTVEQLREAALNLFTQINDVNFLLGPDEEYDAVNAVVDLCMAIGCTQAEIERNAPSGE